ncbi:MAG: RNA-dependent DNA polymerase [Planctomycetota bacterium]|nr:MAG: RNA-dependent DNA polymerase [Planctomycetota bacterium]
MKRSAVTLEEICLWPNLAQAFWRAASAKRQRAEVRAFEADFERKLADLGREVLQGRYFPAPLQQFTVYDPKTRCIRAPVFRDRILHHALMAVIGPELERSWVDDSFACRLGKGTGAAIKRAQRNLRRYPWYLQFDVVSFFDSIDHSRLMARLRRRFRNQPLLELCRRIITAYGLDSNRGLPIGALSSQYFANHSLEPLDRFLQERLRVKAMVRYMDDGIGWFPSRLDGKRAQEKIESFAAAELGLKLHRFRLQRSDRGLSFLGLRLDGRNAYPGLRRRRLYRKGRRAWERAWSLGEIEGPELQRGFSACLAALDGTDAKAWREKELKFREPVDA